MAKKSATRQQDHSTLKPASTVSRPLNPVVAQAPQQPDALYTNEARMDVYRQICDQIEAGRRSGSEEYDKAILTLSSGFLALSIAFVKDVVPLTHVIWMPALIASWVLFAVSVLSTLISFVVSQHAYDVQKQNLDDYFLHNIEDACHRPNQLTTATTALNYLSGLCFIAAVVLTIVFASANFKNENALAKQPKEPAVTEQMKEGTK